MRNFILWIGLLWYSQSIFAQQLYVPGGSASISNSNNTFTGIGTTAPQAYFHLQQTAGAWTDGLRLSLGGKSWDVIATKNGNRLAIGFGQTSNQGVELNAVGTGPALEVKGDLQLGQGKLYFLNGATDPQYLIQSGAWNDGMKYIHYTSHQFVTKKKERMRIASDGKIGIGITAPKAMIHIQQPGGGWSDGLRLTLQGRSWDVSVTNSGSRLAIGFGQTSNQGIELNQNGTGPALEVKGDLQLGQGQPIYFLGSATDPEYLIQSGARTDGMKYKHFAGHQFFTGGAERLRIADNGKIGIGTTTPDALLTVKGDMHARELRLDMDGATAPDYVFDATYDLPQLDTLADYITTHKHLPGIPSATDMNQQGLSVKELNLALLKKMEELTLYVIALKEENKRQQMEIDSQRKMLERQSTGKHRSKKNLLTYQ